MDPDLTPIAFAAATAMAVGAGAVRGLTGFGMAIILVPLLGLILRPIDAVVVGILLQLLIGPVGLKTIVADADRASAVPISVCAFLSTPLGIWALANTSPDVARVVIAAIAVGAFVVILIPRHSTAKPGLAAALGAGIACGVLTGYAAMPGPPVVPFYLRGGYEPRAARASMLTVFLATAIAGTLAALYAGLVQLPLALLALGLFPAVLLGNWLGGLAFGRVPPKVWRTCVGVILGTAAVAAILRLAS